ncbi:MAG: hypothetical protein GXP53_06595 [Deltaproteobacteria bacterium]|nr:hypothetical protein [Deltaproteobacteria bacterium]
MDIKKLVLICLIIVGAGSPLAIPQQAIAGQDTSDAGHATIPDAGLFAGRMWGEVYSDAVSEQAQGYNIIGDLFVKQGLHLFKINGEYLDAYAKTRLNLDVDGNYFYNRWENGIGLRYKPFRYYGLYVYAEYLLNSYLGRELPDEPNPYAGHQLNAQGGLTFWQWWGKEGWQVRGPEYYLPFTGWREVYADAIYYGNENNIVATLDYKEGLMLVPVGPVLFDAYIATQAGTDANGDPWYHFAEIGPGIRVKPFDNLDLQISVEYFMGRYTRGGFGDTKAEIADFEFTIAFWQGW